MDCLSVRSYAVCHVMGVHFRAGEWGNKRPRCGSIITCVIKGRSLYGRVSRFLVVDGDDCPGYASVCWFSEPEYPSGTPLVVRVRNDGSDVDDEVGRVVRVTDIDPSRVMVECEGDGIFFMMRDSGYDTYKCR